MSSSSRPSKPKSVFLLPEVHLESIYPLRLREEIAAKTEVVSIPDGFANWRESGEALREVELAFSGWGMPAMDADFLERFPRLRHVFYGAGSVRRFYTAEALERGIGVSSAWRANAVPVAEYAQATILLSLKHFWRQIRDCKEAREWRRSPTIPGAFRTTVGLLSLGAIGRLVAGRLASHDLSVLAYDPFASEEDAADLGVELADLETVFRESEVISVHTPDLPTTKGLVSGDLLRSLKPGATLINSSRGAVIDEPALVEVLRERPDLQAILDVTATEPIGSESPLWDLPNLLLTPHIAGSMGGECARMGEYMVAELDRYLAGRPLEHTVTSGMLEVMA
jgi:phosphoglycerate dehydrogenase-like enzyme